MFTAPRHVRATSTRLSRKSAALTCGLALAAVLTGTASAHRMEGDPENGPTASVVRGLESSQWVTAKLKTTNGYRVLVYE